VPDVTKILSKTIDLEKVFRSNPGIFNLESLDLYDKIALLDKDPGVYSRYLDVRTFEPEDRVIALLSLRQTRITKLISFTDEELKKLSGDFYNRLVSKDFRYIRAERFPYMNKNDQREIFLNYPQWVLDNFPEPPKFTSTLLSSISFKNPKFIDDYHLDILKQSKTTYDFWISMIKFNPVKYKDLFLKNTNTITTKSQVRAVFNKHPGLVKDLTPEIIQDFKLTVKELVFLIDRIIKDQPKAFKGWKMSAEMTDALQFDLTSEILNGKSNMSGRFKTVMKQVFEEEINKEVVE
jgi:hypothetical protein